ncbi:MAG: hypothetical protein JWR10_603 [Rubritepida sp.]|nr:hypothetical protein [Rubritepida sp.]
MSRGKIAFLIGVVGFILYIVLVVAAGDFIVRLHWALQLLYYAVVGIVWTIPAKWLIVWGARTPG